MLCGMPGFHKFIMYIFLFFAAAGGLSAQSADQLYSGGRQAFTDGLWPTSASQFTRLLREYPEDHRADSAAYMAAVAYHNSRDYDRSIRLLESFPGKYPDSAWNMRVAYWEGLGRYALGDWQGAANAFERQGRLLDEPSYRERALLYLGACREKLEEWAEAEDVYLRLEQDSQDYEISARAVFRLGQIRLADERPAEALTSFSRLAFDYSGSSLARDVEYWIAEAQRRLGRDESALGSYRNFLAAVYESEYRSHALLEAARLAARSGNDEEALAYLDLREREWSAGTDADRPTVLRIRAASRFRTGQLAAARADYQEILRHPASDSEAQSAAFDLAQTWIGTADELNAVAYLEEASSGPDPRISADALYTAGQILLASGAGRGARYLEALATDFPEDSRREESLRLVVTTYRGNNVPAALEALDILIPDYPESEYLPSYLFLRGELFLAEENQTDALRDYGRITREFPGSDYVSDSWSRIGYIYAERGEHVRASEHYLSAADSAGGLSGGEKGRRAIYSAGVALLNGRDTRGAVELFSSLVQSDPSGPWGVEAAYHMGEAFYDSGDYEAARDAYSVAARYGNSHWAFEAAYALGWTWFRQSEWEHAAEAFELAVEAGMDNEQISRSRYRVGLSLASSGNWEDAISHYRRALEYGRAPWREEALYQYSWALLNLEREQDAFEIADILAREYPESDLPADLPFRMGENFMAAGDYPRAVEWYDICTQRYGGSSISDKAGLRAALAIRESGDSVEAARRYGQWIAAHPEDPGSLAASRSWAEALKSSGDPAAAEEARELALVIDPESDGIAVPVVLAWVRVSGIPADSAEILDNLAENENLPAADRAEALLLRAHLYRNEGRYGRARQIYEVLVRDIPGHVGAESQEGLARSYAEEGRIDEAAEAYLAVPYLYPEESDLSARALREAEKLYREAGRTDEADKILERIKGS